MFKTAALRAALIATMTATILTAGFDKAREYHGDGPKMKFVRIPAGSFQMGQPGSRERHEVRITKPFYMGKYEVTQAQWKAVMGTTLRQQRDKAIIPWNLKGEGPEHPMYYVSWADATEFCKKLGRDFRLPTEAEWEYACRAGSQTRFYYGDDPNKSELSQYAWWWDNSDSQTHPVGQKKPNTWGLYDMHGNVREWCSDREDSVISYGWGGGLIDTTGMASDKEPYRVCRGNSWLDKWGRGSVERGWGKEYFRFDDIGFRVVYAGPTGGNKQVLEIALPEESAGFAASPQEESESLPRIIAGVVRDESGQQVSSNIDIRPTDGWILRDYDVGMFEMSWHPSDTNTPMHGYHLIARNKKLNLAMGMEVDREANTLDIQLKPGVVLTGNVVNSDGKGIEKTDIFIYLQKSGWKPDLYLSSLRSDVEGRFEFRALPPGYDYILSVYSSEYRGVKAEIHSNDVRDNRREGILIVLQRGEFSISGVVVDTDGKPVPKMRVYCSAKGQPAVVSHTDANGKFTLNGVFKGRVQVIADGPTVYGSVEAEAGATNVRVMLDNQGTPSLKGRACFPGETDIWVNGEVVPISEIGLMREVAGAPFGYVERIDEHEGKFECRDILLDSGNRISVVESHCFMLDCGRWIAAQDLRAGQKLKTITGTVGIKSVTLRPTPYKGKVYNLKISDSHRYAVGKVGVIVRDY